MGPRGHGILEGTLNPRHSPAAHIGCNKGSERYSIKRGGLQRVANGEFQFRAIMHTICTIGRPTMAHTVPVNCRCYTSERGANPPLHAQMNLLICQMKFVSS